MNAKARKRKIIITSPRRQILRYIHTISRSVFFIRNLEFKKYDIKRGQSPFLTRIVESPGITQEEISLLLRIDRTTTAKVLSKLCAKGFIFKERSETDGRAWCLYPTEKLMTVYPYMKKAIMDLSRRGTRGFTPLEVKTLHSLLERYNNNITDEWERDKR